MAAKVDYLRLQFIGLNSEFVTHERRNSGFNSHTRQSFFSLPTMNIQDYLDKRVIVTLEDNTNFECIVTNRYCHISVYELRDINTLRFIAQVYPGGTTSSGSKVIAIKEIPTMNIQDYLDKEVIVTLQNNTKHQGIIRKGDAILDNFYLYDAKTNVYKMSFFSNGRRVGIYVNGDAVSIEEVKKPEPTSSLKSSMLHSIANVLTPDAIRYIEQHPKYAECMMILIEEFLQKELGDIKGELPFMIMDNIYLNKSN